MASVVKNLATKNVRNFAAQAAAAQQTNYSLPYNLPQVSKLPTGSVVASLENNSPVATVSILFKAGSRYESGENAGVSYLTRVYAGLATKNNSAFKITRFVQQEGGTIVAENGREHIRYTITINRDSLDTCLDLLGSVASQPRFTQWELNDQATRIADELNNRKPASYCMDLAHNAAYRQGLGNSIFVPDFNLKKLASTDVLEQYHASTHTADRMFVSGFGIEHKTLLDFAKTLNVEASATVSAVASSYKGGDARVELGGSMTHLAVVGQGATIGSEEAASFAVAQYLLGAAPNIKYATSGSSKLRGVIGEAGGVGNVSAINCNYSDGGLFGFYLDESADKVGAVSKAITKMLRTNKFTDKEVNQAKMRAKAAVSMGMESQALCVEDMSLQIGFNGSYLGQAELTAALDKVTSASVQKALSKAFGGKLSIGSLGALQNVPYADEI